MTVQENPPISEAKEQFSFSVNGSAHHTHDAIKDGRQLLQLAGFTPPSDHVLIQISRPGSKVVGLDENVDLGARGDEEFHAFRSDRSFNFTADELGYAWGSASIVEPDLRRLLGVAADKVIVLEREDEPDEIIEPGSEINLAKKGTEHFRTAKRTVTVYYPDDEHSFELERRVYTGAELSTIFEVPNDYKLDLIKPNGDFDEIKPNERVKVREGMHFVSHPPHGHSS